MSDKSLDVFSLSMGKIIELGAKGSAREVRAVVSGIKTGVSAAGFEWSDCQ